MSDDIVNRLRDEIDVDVNEPLDRLLEEAADEIERLREENRKLRYEVNRSSYHDE